MFIATRGPERCGFRASLYRDFVPACGHIAHRSRRTSSRSASFGSSSRSSVGWLPRGSLRSHGLAALRKAELEGKLPCAQRWALPLFNRGLETLLVSS
jgi:hypothetical protein